MYVLAPPYSLPLPLRAASCRPCRVLADDWASCQEESALPSDLRFSPLIAALSSRRRKGHREPRRRRETFFVGLCLLLAGVGGVAVDVSQPSQQQTPPAQSPLSPSQGEISGGQASPYQTPLCPDGWARGAVGDRSFKDQGSGLCLHLSPRPLSWDQARAACRDQDSFLLSLDSVVSVEGSLLPQFLKDRGVGNVWAGMHEEEGRQVWDEPGKDMVIAYTGSQRAIGEAKRGWGWDASSFSDAERTCGVYGYRPDPSPPPSGRRRRRRRDTDTPSPQARQAAVAALPVLQAAGTTATPESGKQAADGKKVKDKDKPSDKPSDAVAAASSLKIESSNSEKKGSTDKPGDNAPDKPGDEKSGSGSKSGNGTADTNSDEEDHEMTKRSVGSTARPPTTTEFTLLTNATTANTTASETTTTPAANGTSANLTASSESRDSSSQQNETTGGEQLNKNAGFSQEIMDFFRTDAQQPAGFQPSGASDGGLPGHVPLTPQEFVHRFQTGNPSAAAGDGSANASSQAGSQAAVPSSTVQNDVALKSPVVEQALAAETTPAAVAMDAVFSATNEDWSVNQPPAVQDFSAAGGGSAGTGLFPESQSTMDSQGMDGLFGSPAVGAGAGKAAGAGLTTSGPFATDWTGAAGVQQSYAAYMTTAAANTFANAAANAFDVNGYQNQFPGSPLTTPPPAAPSVAAATNPGLASDLSVEHNKYSPNMFSEPKKSSADYIQGLLKNQNLTGGANPQAAAPSTTAGYDSLFGSKELSGGLSADIPAGSVESKGQDAAVGGEQRVKSLLADLYGNQSLSTESREVDGLGIGAIAPGGGGNASPGGGASLGGVMSPGEGSSPGGNAPPGGGASAGGNSSPGGDLFTGGEVLPGGSSDGSGNTTTAPSRDTSSSSEEQLKPGLAVSEAVAATTTQQARARAVLDSVTPVPGQLSLPEGQGWMSLQHCQQKRHFVCAAKPLVDFLPVDKCPSGWMGHTLLSRCYREVSEPATMSQAVDRCRKLDGALAKADTDFFTNVAAALLSRLAANQTFGTRVWVDRPGDVGPVGTCNVLDTRGGLGKGPCADSLPYICQKKADTLEAPKLTEAEDSALRDPPLILNMTSGRLRPLACPLSVRHADDVVTWYKDGQPIPSDSDDDSVLHSTVTGKPSVLHISLDLLRRLHVTDDRLLRPAMLQGLYWCRVWQREPLHSRTSRRFFVRFRDVVTLQGFVKTDDVQLSEAVFFNQMRGGGGLPAAMATSLQAMSDRIHPFLRHSQPALSDILTPVVHASAETNEVEFRIYLCLNTVAMAPQDKGAVVDGFLKALHTELVHSEDTVRREWNMSLPFAQAFRILMTEMCPEARLVDKETGHEATFPSTPVNQHAVTVDICDGHFTGYGLCSGDLRTGARWSHWEVETSCHNLDQTLTEDTDDDDSDRKVKVNPEDVVDTGTGFLLINKPNPALLDLDRVIFEEENVGDVTGQLDAILDSATALTDTDVGIVADIIDRVALVPVLPKDVGLTLVKTVNRVLDSPLPTLQAAQQRAQSCTRILQDLDKFSEKIDFRQQESVRYVTPNIAMEVWNMREAREPVVGLAARVGSGHNDPLNDMRIVTLSNRTWADTHLAEFDVAIKLPDQLVSGDAMGDGRLSMTIYRKAGLFLSSVRPGPNRDGVPPPELNSAIISATLASTSVNNLEDKVKLIFKPIKLAGDQETRCVYWDFSLPGGGGWSSKGCVHDGFIQGRDVCLCDHLTNFAILLDFYGDAQPLDEANETALSIITIIGLSLSIVGLALTVITFIFFKKLRQGRAQQTLFNVSIALLCSEVVLLVGLKQTGNYGVCLAVAVLLHYLILVSFLWMLIEAVLQYLTFVKVLGTYISKYTLKTVLPAWGIPLIPVITLLAMDYTQYRGRKDYCWMTLDAFYYAFALPVGVIVLFNLVTFVVIMFSLLRRPKGLRSSRNKSNTAETNIKAAFTIFILLGLTWIFGYLAIADARLPFQYLFTVLSSLQGFLIFVMLVARRRQFREQWYALCCRVRGQARGQKVTPTLSNSTSSQSSTSSFASSGRSRSSSGDSSRTTHSLIKRADSNVSRSKVPQLAAKGSINRPR